MSNQNEWFKKVKDVSLTPLQVTKEYLNGTLYTPGKTTLWNGEGLWDHRTVAENEIIFELDGTYGFNIKYKEQIESSLKEEGVPFYTFFTGGKSFHTHCWFNKISFKNADNSALAQEAVNKGFGYREVRKWFVRKICKNAGILSELIGDGKLVDTAPINFASGKKKLIRAGGGKKQAWNAKIKETKYRHYKTYIPDGADVKKKHNVTNIDNVQYPTEIKTFEMNEFEIVEEMVQYLKQQEGKITAEQSNYKGKFLELHGVTKLFDGVGAGQRSAGAQIVAIACVLDGLTVEDGKKTMEKYVAACEQIGSQFTIEEAMGWYEWVRCQPSHFWNCQLLKEMNAHESYLCEFCSSQNTEAIKLLTDKDILKSVEQTLIQMIAGEMKLAMSEYLLFNSRHFKTADKEWNLPNDPKPEAMVIVSDSSSGKSYITKQVLKLFPEESVIVRSRLTKSVLNYMIDQDYDGKIIFIEELQGFDETSNQLRLWISEGVLRLNTVEDVIQEDGTTIKQEVMRETTGQPVIITTTAQDHVDREMLNRSWILSTDTSKTQTKTILAYQDKMEKGQWNKGLEKQIRRLQDMQNEIRPYHFVVPFMDAEAMNIPTDDIKVRRDYKKLVTMVKCVALLYQRQRIIATDEQGREAIVCSFRDFEIAKEYVSENMEATFNGLSNEQVDLLRVIRDNFSDENVEFDLSDIQRVTNKHYNKCYTVMKVLENFGFVKTERGEKNRALYTMVKNKEISRLQLPTFQELKNMFDFGAWFSEHEDSVFRFFGGSSVFETKKGVKCFCDSDYLINYGVEKGRKMDDPLEKLKTGSTFTSPVLPENNEIAVFGNPDICNGKNSCLYKPPKKSKFLTIRPEKQKNEKQDFTQKLSLNDNKKPTKNEVLTFINNSKKMIVDIMEIFAEYDNQTTAIETIINNLKAEGEIYEIKPGKYARL